MNKLIVEREVQVLKGISLKWFYRLSVNLHNVILFIEIILKISLNVYITSSLVTNNPQRPWEQKKIATMLIVEHNK